MSLYQAVLFDMDGLIFDSERMTYRAYLDAAKRFGFRINPTLYMSFCGKVEADTIAMLRETYGPDADVLTWRSYIKERKDQLRAERDGRPGLKPGVRELLAVLDEQGVPYALASSSTRPVIDGYLRAEGLADRFGHIVDGSMVTRGKPDPEAFMRAASLIGAEPARTLVLEDSLMGIRAANAGGFVSGFVLDDLSDLPPYDQGLPIRIAYEGARALEREAAVSFGSLEDVASAFCALEREHE